MSNTPKAKLAERALSMSLGPSTTPDQKVVEILGEFRLAFNKLYPDSTFTVVHILSWAKEYASLSQEPLPQILTNGYSLGKFIRANQDVLAYEEVGSYGNRVVYRATPTTKGKTNE